MAAETINHVEAIWACLVCYYKGRFGTFEVREGFYCPKCLSTDIHPVGQPPMILVAYGGKIGTIN